MLQSSMDNVPEKNMKGEEGNDCEEDRGELQMESTKIYIYSTYIYRDTHIECR